MSQKDQSEHLNKLHKSRTNHLQTKDCTEIVRMLNEVLSVPGVVCYSAGIEK